MVDSRRLASLAVLACLTAGAAARAAIIAGPYVQNARPDAVTIMWETDTAGNSYVDWGPTSAYGNTEGQADSVTIHEVEVNGPPALSADTVYHYRARTGGANSADFTFKTAPVKGTTGFSFIAYGDSRTNEYVHEEVVQSMRLVADDWRTVMLNSGDIVTAVTSPASVWRQEFFGPLHDMISKTPIYVGIGNHEDTSTLFVPYLSPPTTGGSASEYYYSFDYGNVHIVVLNTNVTYTSGSPQYTWLESDLAAASVDADIDWIVACFHHPPFSTSNHGSTPNGQTYLHPLFQTYGVDLVFNGHDHCYERTDQDGVVYIVTGGGGAGLYNQDQPGSYTGSDIWLKCQHFCSIDVTANRLCVKAHAVTLDGYKDAEVFDSIVITSAGEFGPSAVAHPDQFVTAGTAVTLDGSASFDPDGDTMAYQWTKIAGPSVSLGGATSDQATFTPSEAGVYVFELVTTAGGVQSVPDTVTVTVDDATTDKVTLNPVADTWLSEISPSANYGTATSFKVDGQTTTDEMSLGYSLVKFNIPSPPAGKVLIYATLSLYCTNESPSGGYVRTASDNTWIETSVTYSNRPVTDGLIVGSLPQVFSGAWCEVEVTDAIAGAGMTTLVIMPTVDNGTDYSSRESGNPPELHLIYHGDTEPPDLTLTDCVLKGTVNDDNTTPLTILVDGIDVAVNSGNWISDDISLGASPRTIAIEATDSSSNTATVNVTVTW